MDFDTTVRLAIMDSFLAEVGPSVPIVARMLEAPAADVAAAFDRLAASRAIVLQPGTHDILMSAPFAGVRTEFSVRVRDRWYSANCIWDALGIPAMLAGAGRPANARIETRCPDCSMSLGLDLRDGELTAEPPDPVVHFAVPAARWWADVVFT